MTKKFIKVLCFHAFACWQLHVERKKTSIFNRRHPWQKRSGVRQYLRRMTRRYRRRTAYRLEMFVYICGAVNTPGVYEVTQNARLYEVIEAAGGLTEDAAEESVNQAREIVDGEMVRILTQEEAAKDG